MYMNVVYFETAGEIGRRGRGFQVERIYIAECRVLLPRKIQTEAVDLPKA